MSWAMASSKPQMWRARRRSIATGSPPYGHQTPMRTSNPLKWIWDLIIEKLLAKYLGPYFKEVRSCARLAHGG